MSIENGKEIDFIVYEPIRRSDTNLTKIFEHTHKTKKYSGLYNRGNLKLDNNQYLTKF
jgi:hypothetical protein